ncbi:MAG: acetamidase/formamidase family protein [Acidobacteria bacterium]|nr:acetamidase/formamidase family protein [Acidobacteriota bacterium]
MGPFHIVLVLLALGAPEAPAADRPVVRYRPTHGELRYTFGGAPPIRRIRPGTRLVSWTEDCYDGAVTRPDQFPTKVIPPGHDNPQTGPFFVEGAEPGDTLAIRIETLEPARDVGISSFFPGFGALNGTDRTAILGADLPETVWFTRWGTARSSARRSRGPWTSRSRSIC